MRGSRRAADGPPITLAWTRQGARAEALAETVGAETVVIYPRVRLLGDHVLVRYPLSTMLTARLLLQRRPRAIIVQNPPVFPTLIAFLYCRLFGGTLLMDTHPAGFGAKDSRQGQMFLPATRWLVPRVRAVLVTVDSFVELVESWGGRGVVVHEPPLDRAAARLPGDESDARGDRRGRVLFACVHASDEPVTEVLGAARLLPDVEFLVTGDPARAVPPLTDPPPNVVQTGLVPLTDFLDLVESCDVVLSLTTEVTSVARSAYEAIYLRRPLIISRVEAMVDAFPSAVPCDNTASAIAEAVSAVLAFPPSDPELAAAERDARRTWAAHEAQLVALMQP